MGGWFARIPVTPLMQRWDAEKIKEFLEGKAKQVNAFEIYTRIKEVFTRYIDFEKNEGAEVLLSLWCIGTYFHFIFYQYGYIKLGGIKRVGKSKTGRVILGIAFNAIKCSGASASAIFRSAADLKATQIIDEQEHLASNSEEFTAYFQVLNGGFEHDGFAIRTDKQTMKVETLPAYSPKVICGISGLRETLEDRSLEIVLFRSGNQEIAGREPSRPDSPEWRAIRSDLYLLLFQRWKEVKNIYENLENVYGYHDRFWDMARPLLAIGKLVDKDAPEGEAHVEASLRTFLDELLKKKKEASQDTDAARVVELLYEVLKRRMSEARVEKNFKFRIPLKDIVEEGAKQDGPYFESEFKPRRISKILANLKLYEEPKRLTKGYSFIVSLQDVEETAKRYDFILEDMEMAKA
jgi:hypothetical protein